MSLGSAEPCLPPGHQLAQVVTGIFVRFISLHRTWVFEISKRFRRGRLDQIRRLIRSKYASQAFRVRTSIVMQLAQGMFQLRYCTYLVFSFQGIQTPAAQAHILQVLSVWYREGKTTQSFYTDIITKGLLVGQTLGDVEYSDRIMSL